MPSDEKAKSLCQGVERVRGAENASVQYIYSVLANEFLRCPFQFIARASRAGTPFLVKLLHLDTYTKTDLGDPFASGIWQSSSVHQSLDVGISL